MSTPAARDDSPAEVSCDKDVLVTLTDEASLPTDARHEEESIVEERKSDFSEEKKLTTTGDDDKGEGVDTVEDGVRQMEIDSGAKEGGHQDSAESMPCLDPPADVVTAENFKDNIATPEAASRPEHEIAGPSADHRSAFTSEQSSQPAYYLVKWITWKEKKTPIITQSQNGPCPLLAIMNTLFLRWKASLPAQTEVVTTEDLMTHLGECVLSVAPREEAEGMELNFQQNVSDVMAVLPKLSTGLDVNVRFTGVTDFEYTPECIVFDLLDIPLYHGWLVDPQNVETVASVGKLSYNQLVEKIIDCKHSEDSSLVGEGLVAEQFLESTATQLSYHGLCELNSTVKEDEISVFFRNNHFSTMIKHKGHLYLLVTDQGFLDQQQLVWESLHNLEGDGNFCDCNFRLCHPQQRLTPVTPDSSNTQRQIQQDYLVAMSLQQQQDPESGNLTDLDLARQLQQQEYQQQQPQQPQQQNPLPAEQQARAQPSQPRGARRREKDSECTVL